jgi:lactoylglutathione lyase
MNHWMKAILICVAFVSLGVGAMALAQSDDGKQSSSQDRMQYAREVLIQLAVSDLERAMKFYGETLELELLSHQPELEWAKYRTAVPGVTIGIGRQDRVEGSGTISINLGVTDLDKARARLEAKGVEFSKPSVSIPGVVKLADFADPDGNRLRLAGPPDRPVNDAATSTE